MLVEHSNATPKNIGFLFMALANGLPLFVNGYLTKLYAQRRQNVTACQNLSGSRGLYQIINNKQKSHPHFANGFSCWPCIVS
jgi:hypothetical protein